MNSIILLIVPLLVITPTVAFATNELTPFKDKSAPYNSGFSQGYVGIPLKDHHTQEFFAGYGNGSKEMWFSRGEVSGYYNMQLASKNPDYLQGWQQGNGTRHDFGFDKRFISLPPTTDDNYLHFFIGYFDGKRAVDNAPDNQLTANCPPGHTQEYCAGFIGGVNQESYLFHDA